MRIVLIGQATFGAKTLEALLEKSENVVAVYSPPDKAGGRKDPLTEMAQAKKLPVFQPTSYKDDKVFSQFKQFVSDLVILAFVTDIIPARYFESASTGAICYHPSLLPRHRGASAINWAVIMGDTKTGLSIFWPDGGIDTGPILLQKEMTISPDDTTGSLYFNHLFPMGVDAIVESVVLIKANKAPRIPQDESQATYEPPADDRVGVIDWQKPAQTIYDLVRGCDPQPGAYAYWKGEQVRFFGASLTREPVSESPGTVIEVNQQGIVFAVPGGRLIVGKIRTAGSGKLAATDFAAQQGIKVGDRLPCTP